MKIFSFFKGYTVIARLNKLRILIEEKGRELERIGEIGYVNAGVTSDYMYILRSEHLALQREYNAIIDKNRPLTQGMTKIAIDTFKDRWLEKKEYKILDPIEIDIEMRIQNSRILHRTFRVGENAKYEIFSVEGSFVRRDKVKKSTDFLGEGTGYAAVYKEWIYWYENGSILSEKYLYRRSIDGRLFEKLDWLSNKKTLEIAGDFGHYVSEDNVKKIYATPYQLIIDVFRKSENKTYRITVTEIDGKLSMKRDILSDNGVETRVE